MNVRFMNRLKAEMAALRKRLRNIANVSIPSDLDHGKARAAGGRQRHHGP
ncbi:hypothetical protein SAMN04487972_10697 [Paracoccus halophilus]|uniref:Uncharacterized protein n=1 Tax=Paracoccus halophilus TaxID=376733 RepID=A0A1I0TB26_9RHOB|nr:hypothetical protein SAMN04487972_10697 [Paracoccus halophilus]